MSARWRAGRGGRSSQSHRRRGQTLHSRCMISSDISTSVCPRYNRKEQTLTAMRNHPDGSHRAHHPQAHHMQTNRGWACRCRRAQQSRCQSRGRPWCNAARVSECQLHSFIYRVKKVKRKETHHQSDVEEVIHLPLSAVEELLAEWVTAGVLGILVVVVDYRAQQCPLRVDLQQSKVLSNGQPYRATYTSSSTHQTNSQSLWPTPRHY